MTFVRINNKPAKSFNNLVDDLLNGMPSIFRDELVHPAVKHSAPVNITEKESEFVVELVAPGFEKENFVIHLDNNLLTISAEKKMESENNNDKQIRREFNLQSFKRSFTVDENIDGDQIVAKYLNGVLTLNLPKKAEVKEAAKQISIQ